MRSKIDVTQLKIGTLLYFGVTTTYEVIIKIVDEDFYTKEIYDPFDRSFLIIDCYKKEYLENHNSKATVVSL